LLPSLTGWVHSDVLFLGQLRGKSNPKDHILPCVVPAKPTSFNGVKAHSSAFVPVEEIFICYHYDYFSMWCKETWLAWNSCHFYRR